MAIAIRRVTTEQPFTLSVLLTPQDDETPKDPDGQTVTAAVTHVNGTVILPTGTATVRSTAGAYSLNVPPQPQPAELIVTWSYAIGGASASMVTHVSVIGAHYIDLSEIRAMDGIDSAEIYPTAMLVEKRDDVESFFEQATDTFWTPHYVRDVLDGDPNYRQAQQVAYRSLIDYLPSKRLVLRARYPRQLLSLNLAGVVVDPAILSTNYNVYPSGEVEAGLSVAAFPRGMDNVTVEYIAGRDGMPADLRLALKTYIRYLVLNTNARIPDRATSMTTEFGTFRIGQATAWDNPTGIAAVDSVLKRYGERIPAFA